MTTIWKPDLQAFFKALRKKNTNQIKYYAAGEYGSKTMRPHYHIILFNATTDSIFETWKKGDVHIGEVNESTVAYTAKYITKPGKIPQFEGDTREKEFSLMSKRLGDNYLTNKIKRWHKADLANRFYLPIKGGGKLPLPRYYKDKIYTDHQKKVIIALLQDKENKRLAKMSHQEIIQEMKRQEGINQEKTRKNTDNRRKKL